MYACDTCVLRQALDALDADNRRAWTLWQRIAHRLVVDLHAGGQVLAWALADDRPDDALLMVERLAIIYDTLQPAQGTYTHTEPHYA